MVLVDGVAGDELVEKVGAYGAVGAAVVEGFDGVAVVDGEDLAALP